MEKVVDNEAIAEMAIQSDEKSTLTVPEDPWKIIYRHLCEKDDWVSAPDIMLNTELSRASFYSGLKNLRDLKLIEVKVDLNDLRKKYYRAKPDKFEVF